MDGGTTVQYAADPLPVDAYVEVSNGHLQTLQAPSHRPGGVLAVVGVGLGRPDVRLGKIDSHHRFIVARFHS